MYGARKTYGHWVEYMHAGQDRYIVYWDTSIPVSINSPCTKHCKYHLSPCHTVTIYTTIAHELLKVKNRQYLPGQSCDNFTDGAFFFRLQSTRPRCLLDNVIILQTVLSFNPVRLDYDVYSTMYDVCTITELVVAIHVRILAIKKRTL